MPRAAPDPVAVMVPALVIKLTKDPTPSTRIPSARVVAPEDCIVPVEEFVMVATVDEKTLIAGEKAPVDSIRIVPLLLNELLPLFSKN